MKISLCLCMIVKNESKIIKRLFDSVISIIDCYCICDTGSTDDTINIIEEYFKEKNIPGKIIIEPFKNFSYNRNIALENCNGLSDYILLLDADMFLEIKNFVKDLLVSYDEFKILQGNENFNYPNTRIIKNNGLYKYYGVTHEYISGPPCMKSATLSNDILFLNDIGDGGSKHKKFERDIKLLIEGIKEEPNNTRYYFYLANSYRDSNMHDESIEWYKKIINTKEGWVQEKYLSCLRIYDSYCIKKEDEIGIHYLIMSYKFDNKRIEGIYKLVHYYCIKDMNEVSLSFYLLIQHYYENEYLPKNNNNIFVKPDQSLNFKLFVSQVDYKYYLPYYMIIVSEKTKKHDIGIRMYEIIFELQYIDAGEWWANNLIYNLQFFIYKVPLSNTNFFVKYELYLNLLKNRFNIKHVDLINNYEKYYKDSIIINKDSIIINKNNIIINKEDLKKNNNVFIYWTGSDYSLIKILRKLIYLKSENETAYKVNFITRNNVKDYIKNLPECFDSLLPAHQADFIRVNVICDYGGIWLDSDVILMDNLSSLFNLIKEKDGFFIKQNNEIIYNGLFGSKPDTPLMLDWQNYINNILLIKKNNIYWEEIGNTYLQKIFIDTELFNNYKIFDGLDNMYPINYNNCVTEFLEKPYENYKNIEKEYQPIIVLVNSVYKKLSNFTEDEIMNKNLPLNYFLNKAFDNNYTNEIVFKENDPVFINSPNKYFLHINNANYETKDVTLIIRNLVMKTNNKNLKILSNYNNLFGDPCLGKAKNLLINYSYVNNNILDKMEKIPKIFFQTSKDGIPEYVINMIKKKLNDKWSYIHFTNQEQLQFLKDNYLEEFPNIIEKYNYLKLGSHKADLFRYYFLYLKGGFHIDSDAMIYDNIDNIVKEYSFMTVLSCLQNHICNGFIGSVPKNKIIYKVLHYIYNLDLNELDKNYQLLCNNMYNILSKNNDYNIKLYQEISNHDNLTARTVNDNDETIIIHYPVQKIIPHDDNIKYILPPDNIKKYIIIADWLLTFVYLFIYLFCKKLENFGWNIILLSKLDINKLKNKKSVVLCVTFDDFDIRQLKCSNIILLYFLEDIYPYKQIRDICINSCDYLIGRYTYLFSEWSDKYINILNKPTCWIPHAAVNEYYENLEFNEKPKNKIFVSGYINDTYPFRKYMADLSKINDNIEVLQHPNYENNNRKHQIINDEYYKKLNEYICCFTCGLLWKYVLSKIFEISSTGSLLLVEDTIKDQLNELGYYDNINCIMCNKENVEEKIEWILNNKNIDVVNKIRKEGMILTREKHNIEIRADKLNEYVNKTCCNKI